MRILLVTSEDKEIGGVASVIGNLARDLQKRGHYVIFLNSGKTTFLKQKITKWGFVGFELNLQMPFGDRHSLPSLAIFLIRFPVAMYQLIRLIQKHQIQIINIHYPTDCFVYFALCRRIVSTALITSVHGADLFPDGKPKARYPYALRLLLKCSDRITAPSDAYRRDVSRLFPEYKYKTVYIHNGVDFGEFESFTCDSPSANRPPYVLCVAMHNEKKGIDVLIQAFAEIQHREPELRLVLAGDGPLRSRLENLAGSLGVANKIQFLGRQGRTQVVDLLRHCKIFVLPSRSEPFGIVLTEAMACKKPIVSTTVGGIPEIIESQKNGILVEPDDPKALAEAMLSILADVNLQRQLAENGFVTVRQRFGVEHTGSAYEAVFANLVASKDSGLLQAA